MIEKTKMMNSFLIGTKVSVSLLFAERFLPLDNIHTFLSIDYKHKDALKRQLIPLALEQKDHGSYS